MGETLVPVIETSGMDIHFLRMKLVVRAFAHHIAPDTLRELERNYAGHPVKSLFRLDRAEGAKGLKEVGLRPPFWECEAREPSDSETSHLSDLLYRVSNRFDHLSDDARVRAETAILDAATRMNGHSEHSDFKVEVTENSLDTDGDKVRDRWHLIFERGFPRHQSITAGQYLLLIHAILLSMRLNPDPWALIEFNSIKKFARLHLGEKDQEPLVELRYSYRIRSASLSHAGKVDATWFGGNWSVYCFGDDAIMCGTDLPNGVLDRIHQHEEKRLRERDKAGGIE
jgi:hypothetical protein